MHRQTQSDSNGDRHAHNLVSCPAEEHAHAHTHTPTHASQVSSSARARPGPGVRMPVTWRSKIWVR
eukprot:3933322-Rhodomonas_salina.2